MIIIAVIAIVAVFFIMIRNTGLTGKAIGSQTKVLLKTSMGDIVIELYKDKSPITVENFLSYVKEGAYDGTVFHRVIDEFMIQGGGFTPDGKQKPTREPIKLESNNGLKNEKYTLAMARTTIPDSAANQFFINTNNNEFLNYGVRDEGYAVFGKVIKGQEVVDKIGKSQTTAKNGMTDWPVKNVIIEKAEIIG